MRHPLAALSLLSLLSLAAFGPAQEVDFREELRFADALRSRGDNDHALEVIQKLRKVVPPDLAKELALEEAKTRLRVAADEPDVERRLRLYAEARGEFDRFIADNPGHPRVAEANLDAARVLNLTGRTQLNKALLAEDKKTGRERAALARATLVAAAEKLKAAAAALAAQRAAAPEPDGDAKQKKAAGDLIAKLDREIKQTEIERGLNLYDQAETYLGAVNESVANLLLAGKKFLDPIADGPGGEPTTWVAQAWKARIVHRIESRDKARLLYKAIIDDQKSETPVNTEGMRLAKYFRMLLFREQPPDELKTAELLNKRLIANAVEWRSRYARYLKTPEGYGVTFLLSEIYLAEADRNKAVAAVNQALARGLLTELERSENEYTERARRLKIRLLSATGLFTRPIEKLTKFEDFYVRAQYEAYQTTLDPVEEVAKQLKAINLEKITDAKEKRAAEIEIGKLEAEKKKLEAPGGKEKKQKQHADNILVALKAGLALPETKAIKGPAAAEVDTARSMLAYWSLSAKQYEDAVRFGEGFARDSSSRNSSQAASCALIAVQGYQALIARKPDTPAIAALEKKLKSLPDPAGLKDADEKKQAEAQVAKVNAEMARLHDEATADLRQRLAALAQFMEERWPDELAGQLASHTLALQMLRDDNARESIKKLSALPPTYANIVQVRFLLAQVALKAESEKLDPIEGDRAGDYRKRALWALEGLPASALGVDPTANYQFVVGKVMLAAELFRFGRYERMEQIAATYLPEIDKLSFHDEADKNLENRRDLKTRLTSIRLWGRYGQAEAAFAAKDNAKVADLLDPTVDAVNNNAEYEVAVLKETPNLSSQLMRRAMEANLQLGKIDRTDAVLEALGKVGDNAGGNTTILRQMAFMIRNQIDDLRRKGDKEGQARAVKGYTAILDKQIAKVKGALPADFLRVLADCYSGMNEHGKAAERLAAIPEPAKAAPGSPEDLTYKNVRVALAREYRLSKDKASIEKAREVMDKLRGPDMPKSKAWARNNVTALLEHNKILQAEGKWAQSFAGFQAIVNFVKGKAAGGGDAVKELYFDAHYHMILSTVRLAQERSGKEDREQGFDAIAAQMLLFEGSWEDFGSEAWKQKYVELMDSEPGLKGKYQARKMKK